MEYSELSAPRPLDALVRCFWFLSGDSLGTAAQIVVPDGRLEIILHLADPFYRLDASGAQHLQGRTMLSGQLTGPITLRAGAATDIVGIRFRTAAAKAVLAIPLADLNDRVESLDCVAPRLSLALYAAAERPRTPAARVAVLSQVLMRFAVRSPDPLASAVIDALASPEAPKVGLIADRFGVTARTLERKVRENTGLAPNVLRRVLRFRRAFRMLDGAPPGTWAKVALCAGYFDQAHLIRDFRQFAGSSPSEFFGSDPELSRALLAGDEVVA